MKAQFFKHILEFKRPGGTSRGILKTKETYIIELQNEGKKGIGECGIFRGLSYDDVPDYKEKLSWLCENIHLEKSILHQELKHYPSIWFGLEQALLNLNFGEDYYFPSEFTAGKKPIEINGLIWMGDVGFMKEQIQEKLEKGFHCIKLKIGVHWESEKEILKNLRSHFPQQDLELRVDANGGFSFKEAKIVLQELKDLEIHSIEQPIKSESRKVGKSEEERWSKMADLCRTTPTPIALDEELIGIIEFEEKKQLLEKIQPQYIILKPSLIGGIAGADEWISIAEEMGIGWWITSALESNIGLNAIAQYTFTKNPQIPQGLGTGALFNNNFDSKLDLKGDQLWHKN